MVEHKQAADIYINISFNYLDIGAANSEDMNVINQILEYDGVSLNCNPQRNVVYFITIEKKALTLGKGASATLGVTVKPEYGREHIRWASSNKNIVSVNSNGVVTAINEGKATITAESEVCGYYDTCEIIVQRPLPLAITSVSPNKVSSKNTGTKIRWTCNAIGGTNPDYYFYVYKGSTIVAQSTGYTSNNYIDFTPTAAGTDHRVKGVVEEYGSASSTEIYEYSSYYTIDAGATIQAQAAEEVEQIEIESFTIDREEVLQVGMPVEMTVEAVGGSELLYRFKVYDGSELVYSTKYTTENACE